MENNQGLHFIFWRHSEIFKLRGKQKLPWSDCECTVRSGPSMFADVHTSPGLHIHCYHRHSKDTLSWWSSFFTFIISFFPNPFMSEYLSMDSSVMESGRIHYLFKGVLFKYKSMKLLLLLKMFIDSKQCKPCSDAALRGVWSGSTLFASVTFSGCWVSIGLMSAWIDIQNLLNLSLYLK